MHKTRTPTIFRIFISAGFVVAISLLVGTSNVTAHLARIDPILFIAACALCLLGQWLNAQRWRMLLQLTTTLAPSTTKLFSLVMVGMFFNTVLPSTVGGDLIRAEMLRKQIGSRSQAYSSVLVGRLLSLLAIVATCLVATLLAPWINQSWSNVIFLMTAASIIVAVSISMFFALLRTRLSNSESPLIPRAVRQRIENAIDAIAIYSEHRLALFRVFACAILANLIGCVAVVWLLALALGIDIHFSVHLVIVPLVAIITLVPISINGLGLREGSFAILYLQAGVPMADSVSVSIAYSILLTVLGITGGLFLLLGKRLWTSRRSKIDSAVKTPD